MAQGHREFPLSNTKWPLVASGSFVPRTRCVAIPVSRTPITKSHSLLQFIIFSNPVRTDLFILLVVPTRKFPRCVIFFHPQIEIG